jgi:hypothetical protein
MNFAQLPNFFIIGAAKSGTTSLFDIIAQHPSVYASPKKEIRFFSNDDRYANGPEWYIQTHFSGAEAYKIRMEATPAYLTWSQKAAPQIKKLYGDQPVKFTAIFRDPVKRAYSHYWHRVRQGNEDPNIISFPEAIRGEDKRLQENWQKLEYEGNGLYGYFRAGCYATRLKPYLELFPRENFFFMLQEDLYNNFQKNMTNLLSFLEIDEKYPLEPVISNESAIPRNQALLTSYRDFKKTKLKDFLKFFFPSNARKWFHKKALMKPFNYPPMEDSIKRELYERYAEEIRQTERILGRDLSHWKY